MKFVLDPALGKLAKWLRILGHDAIYWRGDQKGLIELAERENRVIITKTRKILQEAQGRLTVFFVTENNPFLQLKEVIGGLKLKVKPEDLFSRCLICNEKLISISPENVKGRVPDYVYRTQGSFSECPKCRRVFWGGTHYERMMEDLRRVIGEDNGWEF